MALYADLHRHLGGALHPRIIYKFLQRHDHPVLGYFPDYDGFYSWFTRPCRTLEEFVKSAGAAMKVSTANGLWLKPVDSISKWLSCELTHDEAKVKQGVQRVSRWGYNRARTWILPESACHAPRKGHIDAVHWLWGRSSVGRASRSQ